jgi:hypothetical protein
MGHWMAGSSPAMTIEGRRRFFYTLESGNPCPPKTLLSHGVTLLPHKPLILLKMAGRSAWH